VFSLFPSVKILPPVKKPQLAKEFLVMKRCMTVAICCFVLNSAVRAEPLSSGVDSQGFDPAVRMQDDLFLSVNGQWLKHTPIPDDKSNYGSFTILMDEALLKLRAIIEEAAEGQHLVGSDEQKVGDFYRSYMNEQHVEQLGLDPLRDQLARIDQLSTIDQVIEYFGSLQHAGVPTPIGFVVEQDDKNSTQYHVAIVQSGTTLPDRDYYLQDDPKFSKSRDALRAYVIKLFQLSGLDHAEQAADNILQLEKRLAEVQWERTQLRDAEKRYNKFKLGELVERMPHLPWPSYLSAAGAPGLQSLNVMTPSFFEGLQQIVADTPLDVWKQYVRFRLIDAYAPLLSAAYVDAHFQLHSQEIAGIPQQLPRWKRAVEATSGAAAGDFGVLGDVVGRLFVQRHFPAESKERMDQLVQNLLAAYQRSIGELTWMTDVTKQRAQEKLSKIRTKIGYPEKWRDYEGLTIRADDLVGNVMRSAQLEHQRQLDKLGRPVDRDEWSMTPQTVNAYYNPGLNEIVFPAAILQPPFFDPQAEDAVNYGGIGAVIGHEISHAFDDQGSKYDGDGNLNNWWTDQDRSAFTNLTAQLVKQYSAYEPLPGKYVDGELTLGENIADLSGMSIAYKAYQLSLGDTPAPQLDGWTGDQRFFIGWSQIWRRKYRDAEMVRRLLTDPHSPSRYRANGPPQNLDAFYQAFQVQEGDAMYKPPGQRIRIW
jgi:predicted metalloendopeptidase